MRTYTIGATTPIDDFRFVDLVPHVVGRCEARHRTGGTVDVDHPAADATDQMVMVVADPILEARGRSRRLNAAEEAFGNQEGERVVHGLERYGADLGSDSFGHAVGCDVGLIRHDSPDRQSLGRNLNTALAKKVSWISGHSPENRSEIGTTPSLTNGPRWSQKVFERILRHSASLSSGDRVRKTEVDPL